MSFPSQDNSELPGNVRMNDESLCCPKRVKIFVDYNR
jgi:hypothetical protein